MTKLTITEQKLMAQVATSRMGRIVVSHGTGNGAEGGRINYGSRDYDAALKLMNRGLLVLLDLSRHIHTRHGWSIHTVDLVLTAAPQN